jgi:transcriptional regulator with XRE-family HTH domain
MSQRFRATVSDSQLRSWRRQGITYESIAQATGMTISEVSRRLHTLYSVPKKPDPTPRAIRLACAAIRRGWSEQEREQRCVRRCGEWTPTVVPASVLACANAWRNGFDELPEFMPTSARS